MSTMRTRDLIFNTFRFDTISRVCVALFAAFAISSIGFSAEEKQQSSSSDTSRPANHLAKESSPYLLLHAHNPVDWYPWGPEAFERARKENKPIFLSIGYSSCYWCHVMERLVFENEDIARQMNEHFINIKVDREERPDVDDIYMTALQVYFRAAGSDQSGGWPLSMFLTSEGKPIAGGTYFPPESKDGITGFPTVLERVANVWKTKQEDIQNNAEQLTLLVRAELQPRAGVPLKPIDRQLVTQAAQELAGSYDAEHGGIDFNPTTPNAPKFIVPAKLALLQYEAERASNAELADIVYKTLDQVAAGGIRDHLGGGFHRYSTDRRWLVPHFEKMLYDQAQIIDVYADAYRVTQNETYREVIDATVAFVLRELTDPAGGFYSALDAETDGVEGQRYVWSVAEVDVALGADDAAIFKRAYGMDEPQVFEHGYVLHLPQPIAETAAALKLDPKDLNQRLTAMRAKLLAARDQRPALLRDDKVLTSWNGLMIRALANAGRILSRDDYVAAAAKAAEFTLSELRDSRGHLLCSWRGGEAKLNAYLDDYAFLTSGLLALHQATGNERWLAAARELTDLQIKLFWDENEHAFFFTSHDHEALLARTKNAYDAVMPSGNSVSVRNLLQLAKITGDEKYKGHAEQTLQRFSPYLEQAPRALAYMAVAAGEYLDGNTSHVSAFRGLVSPLNNEDDQVALVDPPGAQKKKDELVKPRAFLSVEKLQPGGECRVVVFLDIQPGWHINANPPSAKHLKPTEIIIHNQEKIQLANIVYPKPVEARVEGFDEPLNVYEGRVAIYGVLKVPAGIKAAETKFEIEIKYQACNDRECQRPTTVTLDGKVPIAAPGEKIVEANAKLFPKQTAKQK